MQNTGIKNRIKKILAKTAAFSLIAVLALSLSGCSKEALREKEIREEAITFLEAGDYSAAVARFNEALTHRDGKYGKVELDILKYRAEAELLDGDFAAARKTYRTLRIEDEDKAEYQNMEVICIVKSDDDLEEATKVYLLADKTDPMGAAHREALYALGSALSKTGNPDDVETAKSLYLKAIEQNPSGELYNRMGTIEFNAGQIDQAIAKFEQGRDYTESSENPEDKEVLSSIEYNIAICYEYKHDYIKALELFRAYTQKYGTNDTLDHEMAFLESRIQ